MRKPLEIPVPTAEELAALDTLYRTTRDVRLRTRAQIVLLAAEQRLTAPAIAAIVREDDQTVRNWLKRWLAEGIEGLKDRPMPGAPPKITKGYAEQLLCLPQSGDGPAVWNKPTRCGRSSDWRITWPSRQAFACRGKPCASYSKQARSC